MCSTTSETNSGILQNNSSSILQTKIYLGNENDDIAEEIEEKVEEENKNVKLEENIEFNAETIKKS